jgi:hypothetical protein
MRKALGVLFACSLLVPVGIWAAAPGGTAVNTTVPTCKSFSGTETFSPGLPKLGSTTLVKPVQKLTASFTGCSGGGITKGTDNGSTKATTATNCTQLSKNAGKPAAPTTSTTKWSNGQTSTASAVLTTNKVTATLITATIVAKSTAGLGKGHTTTISVTATPNKGFCVSSAFTSLTFKSTKITYK